MIQSKMESVYSSLNSPKVGRRRKLAAFRMSKILSLIKKYHGQN